MREPPRVPLVHVIDDDEVFRRSLVYTLGADGVEARSWATGEDFLSAWHWGDRGVVTLDINIDIPGAMRGPQVFDRLLALRCPMPVIFLTGPHGDDTALCKRLVTRRSLVDYFPRRTPPGELQAAVLDCLAQEPAMFERADKERQLLQVVLSDLTHGQRLAMAGALAGQESRLQAHEMGLVSGTIELQRSAGMARVPVTTRKWPVVAGLLSPLMDRMGAADRVDLAAIELCLRLRQLSPAQQVALATELSSKRPSSPPRPLVAEGLELLQSRGIPELREWLKSAAQEQLAAMLARLPEPHCVRLRTWLEWLAHQGSVVARSAFPQDSAD